MWLPASTCASLQVSLPSPPAPVARWVRACQAILLRRRTANPRTLDRVLGLSGSSNLQERAGSVAGVIDSLYGGALFGPQICVRFRQTPAAGSRPAAADISAEVSWRPGLLGVRPGTTWCRSTACMWGAAA